MSVGLLGEGGTFLWRCRLFVRIVLSACVGGKLVIRKCDMCRSLHRVLSSFVCHAFRANMCCFSIFCDFFCVVVRWLFVSFLFAFEICWRTHEMRTCCATLRFRKSHAFNFEPPLSDSDVSARQSDTPRSLNIGCTCDDPRRRSTHPFPTHRKLILKKTKVTTINKLANNSKQCSSGTL